MEEEKYDMETIDRYVKGIMEEKELQEFKTQMNADPELLAEVEVQKDIVIGTEAYFDNELKEKLRQIDSTPAAINTDGKQVFFKPWKTAAIAASILLLFTVGYFVFFNQPNPEQLYLSYYEPYPNIVSPIQRSESNLEDDALSYYERGDYQTAVVLFEAELEQKPNEDYLLFYSGLSNLKIGASDRAIILLEKVTSMTDSRFHPPAQWYLALAHLSSGEIELAKSQLQTIINADGDYRLKAEKLLDEI